MISTPHPNEYECLFLYLFIPQICLFLCFPLRFSCEGYVIFLLVLYIFYSWILLIFKIPHWQNCLLWSRTKADKGNNTIKFQVIGFSKRLHIRITCSNVPHSTCKIRVVGAHKQKNLFAKGHSTRNMSWLWPSPTWAIPIMHPHWQ